MIAFYKVRHLAWLVPYPEFQKLLEFINSPHIFARTFAVPSVIIFDNFVNVRKTPDQANCTLWTRSRSFHTHTVSKGWNSFVGVNYPFRFSGLRWSTWEGSIFLSLSRKAKESCQRRTKLKGSSTCSALKSEEKLWLGEGQNILCFFTKNILK